jgi:ribonuclease BN (tRNA processing enzyme)
VTGLTGKACKDADQGSVVFSGDSGPSGNLVRLAADTAVLVLEVITQEWVAQ